MKVKHLCAHIDISIEEMRPKARTTLKTVNFVLLRMSHSLKVPYTSPISYRVLNLAFFLGGEGKRLFQILSLRRGANSKRGAYLKEGANSSNYGNDFSTPLT